jgi:hypothetical protein
MNAPIKQPSGALQLLQNMSGYSGKAAEFLDWTYWDSFKMLSTVLTHDLFTIPLGQAGKNLSDTNWLNASQLPQGQAMDVKNLKIFYIASEVRTEAELEEIYQTFQDTTFNIKIPGKDSMGQWTMMELMGTATLIQVTPSVAGDNITQIQPRYHGIFPLNNKFSIGGVQTIKVEVINHVASPASLDDDKVFFGLNGNLVRMS